MAARPLALVLALLVLAGCIGAKQDPVKPASVNPNNSTNASNPDLPDGRGQSLGNLETNKTVNSTVDGKEHKHDYWKGKDNVVIYDADVGFFPTPLFPDGQGTQPKSVAYIKLPGNSSVGIPLVYEGSDKVSVLATLPADAPPAPPPPVLKLQYRSAADSAWRDAGNLAYGTAAEIKVEAKETDMPHSVLSLWVFRITTDNPSATSIHLKITTHKGRDVVNWPGHPAFYADRDYRVVADHKKVKTHMSGIVDNLLLYDQGGTWASPDKLVSYGTGKLDVFINITGATADVPTVTPTGYFLEAHNATIIGPEAVFGDRYFDSKNDLKSYHFTVPVDGQGMDGPYQPSSRWGFRVMATFDPGGVAGLCPGCFGYDIEYELTVVAHYDPKAAGMAM